MTPCAVELKQLTSVPLAVIRRQAHASELARLVPECCGLVWNAVRAQQTRAGRHVALYWDGSIRLEAGVELLGPFVEQGEVVRSATPAGAVAVATHFGPYGGPVELAGYGAMPSRIGASTRSANPLIATSMPALAT